MEKIAVLMSTYNGEKYLSIQIDSILAQEGVEVELYIRDDGSSDSTVEIINKYVVKDKRIHFIPGPPLGVGRSFMTLLMEDIDADFYSFSDQDDYWYPDKLKIAVAKLKSSNNHYTLYCCNQNCVDGDGLFLYTRFPKSYQKPPILSQILKNDFAGCTMVFGNDFRSIIINNIPPLDFFVKRIHDSWLACVACTLGQIIFDKDPHMDFRRNIGNYSDESVSGNRKKSRLKLYLDKIKHLKRRGLVQKRAVNYTALYLLNCYKELLDLEIKEVLILIRDYPNNFFSKIKLLVNKDFNKSLRGEIMLSYLKVLFNIL